MDLSHEVGSVDVYVSRCLNADMGFLCDVIIAMII
jgi:hypothetical protein